MSVDYMKCMNSQGTESLADCSNSSKELHHVKRLGKRVEAGKGKVQSKKQCGRLSGQATGS